MTDNFLSPQLNLVEFIKGIYVGGGESFLPWPDRGYFIPTSSAAAAMCMALSDLTTRGVIKTKNDNLLLSGQVDYLTAYVCQPFVFPTVQVTESTKVVMVSHQFGFPQNLEEIQIVAERNNWEVIEDCTHTIDGVFKYRPKNETTKYAIFNFSNFFPTLSGGGLWVKDMDTANRIKNYIKQNNKALYGAISFMGTILASVLGKRDSKLSYSINAISSSCPKQFPLTDRLVSYYSQKGLIKQRVENWLYIREMLSGFGVIDDLEECVIPIAVPLSLKQRFGLEYNKQCMSGNELIFSYFDANRNICDPKLEKRAIFPITNKTSKANIESFTKIITQLID